jgi:hypothetical protein
MQICRRGSKRLTWPHLLMRFESKVRGQSRSLLWSVLCAARVLSVPCDDFIYHLHSVWTVCFHGACKQDLPNRKPFCRSSWTRTPLISLWTLLVSRPLIIANYGKLSVIVKSDSNLMNPPTCYYPSVISTKGVVTKPPKCYNVLPQSNSLHCTTHLDLKKPPARLGMAAFREPRAGGFRWTN